METTTAAPAAATTSGTVTAPISTPASTPVTTETVNPGAWMAGLNDDQKGFIATKQYKGVSDVLHAYKSLETLIGVPPERALKLPEKFYDDKGALTQEGRSIYERLGAPKEAKEYGLEKFLTKENGDPKLMETMSKVFHDSGIPKSAAEKIAASWNEYQAKTLVAMNEQAQAKFRDADTSLKKEWGAAYDQNRNIALEGMRRMEISDKEVDSISATLGHDKTMKFLKKIGEAVGESTFVTGQNPNRLMDPATAKSKINELKADKSFGDRLANKDVTAREQWDSLHKMAYPGQIGL